MKKKEITMRKNPDGKMEKIRWVPIVGFEDKYSVDQFGYVKSHERWVKTGLSGFRLIPARVLRRQISKITRVISTCLYKSHKGKQKASTFITSRLVAEAFLGLDKMDKKTYVSVKDNDKTNIYYKNLEIVSPQVIHSIRQIGRKAAIYRSVVVIFKDDSMALYESIRQASKMLGVSDASIRSRLLLNGRMVASYGCRDYHEDDAKLNLTAVQMNRDMWKIKNMISKEPKTRIAPDGEEELIIWKDIKGYEGLYIINQFGEIKSRSRSVVRGDGATYYHHGKFMKPLVSKSQGVMMIGLRRDKQANVHRVRQLVAEAFLNYDRDDLSTNVIVKDGVETNDYYKNLEVVARWPYTEFDEVRKVPKDRPSMSKNELKQSILNSFGEGYSKKHIMKMYNLSSEGLKYVLGVSKKVVEKKVETSDGSTLSEVKLKIQHIFGNSYDYPNLKKECVNLKSTITAVCPIHGKFKIRLQHLIVHELGCHKCEPMRSALSREYGKDKSRSVLINEYERVRKTVTYN